MWVTGRESINILGSMTPSTTPTSTTNFPSLRFKYPWRPEQKRVLTKLESYLDDKRIHIVAAPGAGKTVIGLEIFKRFQLKALAISPTMVVRDQWMERLSDFLPEGCSSSGWCSRSLTQPDLFTTTTYQGLYSFDKRLNKLPHNQDSPQDICLKTWFKQHEIKLLILDEAHHLKAAWWEVLMRLVEDCDDLIIVSLTATPPYDASVTEWTRYMKLCGPVDEEISIPELVRSRSLCPHQDYIWMVNTDEKNVSSLNRQQEQLKKFIIDLTNHHELHYLLQLHDWLDLDHPPDVKAVLYNLDECFALLGLLKQQQQTLPSTLLTILEKSADDIQAMDVFDWEVLLQSFIDGQHYPKAVPVKTFRETLATLLRNKHFLKHTRVRLDNSARKLQAFNKTQERVKGCFDIANVEYASRQEWMRLVVLADYIRDEKYQLALDGLEAPTGCYPIFHYYIHHLDPALAGKTALLTGRLSIIHRDLLSKLAVRLPKDVELASIPYSEHVDYVVLLIPSQYLSVAFTALHKTGDLQVLIGTRALLGEGWDAPHVNALILATQTGAYVTTNQLRGRAIRIDPEDDLKTASIWHIIAVAPDMTHNELIFQDLNRRFKTFAGIHASELQIESGIERLVFAEEEYNEAVATNDSNSSSSFAHRTNQLMINRLEDDVYNLQARWQNALEKVEKHVFQLGLQVELSKSRQWQQLTYVFTEKAQRLTKRYRFFDALWPSKEIEPMQDTFQQRQGLLVRPWPRRTVQASAIGLLSGVGLSITMGFSPFIMALTGVGGIGLALLSTALAIASANHSAEMVRLERNYEVAVANLEAVRRQSSLNDSTEYEALEPCELNSVVPTERPIPSEQGTLRLFAEVVLNALRDSGQIHTQKNEALEADEVTITQIKPGSFRFSLNGFTRQENDTFLTGLSQLLEPIRQPRYVLVLAENPEAHQIVPVPHILGSKKKNASAFADRWNQIFSPKKNMAILHWTATPEGQRYLLKARVAGHDDIEEIAINLIDRWE